MLSQISDSRYIACRSNAKCYDFVSLTPNKITQNRYESVKLYPRCANFPAPCAPRPSHVSATAVLWTSFRVFRAPRPSPRSCCFSARDGTGRRQLWTSSHCCRFIFDSSTLVGSRGVTGPQVNLEEKPENAQTVIAHIAKMSIDRSVELTADVHCFFFFQIGTLKISLY